MDDESKIGQALHKQIEQEDQIHIEKALQEDLTEKKDNKNLLILIAVLVGIFALSFGGVKVYEQVTGASVINIDELHLKNLKGELNKEKGYVYNGYSFVYVDGLWWTEMKKEDILLKIPLHFGPKEVGDTKIEGKLNPNFNNGTEVYIPIDPEYASPYYSLALSELNFNIVKGIERKPVGVCTKNNSICDNRTTLSCGNTEGKPVIELKEGEEQKILLNETCILISGKNEGLVKAVDRLIWQWYGIIGESEK